MRFALLGHDEFTASLVEALRQAGQQVVYTCDLGPQRPLLERLFPSAGWITDWTTLLERQDVEATIIARSTDEEVTAEQLRRFAQLGATVLVSHPMHSSVLVYFELEMICAETRARLVPYCPWRWRAGVDQLGAWIADADAAPPGRCEQLLLERASSLRDAGEVTALFARDVDLAMHLVGDLNSLSAMAPAWEQGQLGNLGIQMTGPAGIPVRWSITPPETQGGLRLTYIGAAGKATLTVPDDGSPGELFVQVQGESRPEPLGATNAIDAALADLLRKVGSDVHSPTWKTAARGMELADSIELSLRKGKTIPLYNTAPSEQGTFKGVMAAMGCFLMFASLGLVLLGLLLARFGVPYADKIPIAVAALLIVFLSLQTLRFVFPRSR